MADGSLARRYAKALIELGVEGNCLERITDDLITFHSVLDLDAGADGRGELRKAIENPGFTIAERKAVLEQVLPRLEMHDFTTNFVKLLLEKNRFLAFDEIKKAYEAMADERAGRVRATVTTAQPLSFAMADEINRALEASTGKKVVVSLEVDPSLIGGIVAKIGDLVIDASVRARLEQMRQQLLSDPSTPVGEA